jgi:hypothetical protein
MKKLIVYTEWHNTNTGSRWGTEHIVEVDDNYKWHDGWADHWEDQIPLQEQHVVLDNWRVVPLNSEE